MPKNVSYKILVRVDNKAGSFEPGDGKPILTLGEAHAYAGDLADDVPADDGEIVILEQRVVARVRGKKAGVSRIRELKQDDGDGKEEETGA